MATTVTAQKERRKSRNRATDGDAEANDTQASGEQLLELLGDQYTRRVLQAVVDEPKSGSEIVEDTSVSKATAYRRIETLQEAGLVESRTVFDPDGHHHEKFWAVVDEVSIEIRNGALSAEVTVDSQREEQPGHSPFGSD